MKENPAAKSDTPEEELEEALERVHHIILSHEASEFRISIDGREHLGNYARRGHEHLIDRPEPQPLPELRSRRWRI